MASMRVEQKFRFRIRDTMRWVQATARVLNTEDKAGRDAEGERERETRLEEIKYGCKTQKHDPAAQNKPTHQNSKTHKTSCKKRQIIKECEFIPDKTKFIENPSKDLKISCKC